MATEVASAEVSLEPTVSSGFTRTAERAGQDAGQTFGQSFYRGADGRLRDSLTGRFVAQSKAAGTQAGDGAGRSFGRSFGSKLTNQGQQLGRTFGKVLAGGIAVGAAGGAVLMKDAIGAASDLGETVSKVNQIFGGADGNRIVTWSKDAATAMGQSQQQALDAAATFATFGKSAGLSGEDLRHFSTRFSHLATDLASFHNASPQEAIEAIGAALRGEAEPMRRFGVLLDDATLREEALRLGLIKTTKQALTPGQKVLASRAAILKQTSDAQGDFARTSSGLANQQRILSARFEDTKAKIGAVLLPVALRFVTFLNTQLGPALGKARDAFRPVGDYLRDTFGPVIERVTGFMRDNPAVVKAFAIALGVLALAIGVVTLATTAFSLALNSTGIPLIILGIAALVAGLVYAYQRSEAFRSVVQKVGDIVRSFAGWVKSDVLPVVLDLANKVGNNLRPVWEALKDVFVKDVLPAVQKLLGKFSEWQPTIQKVVGVVVRLVAKFIDFYTKMYGRVLPVLIRFAGFIISEVVPKIASFVGAVVRIIAKIVDFGRKLVDGGKKVVEFAKKIGDKISEILQWFKDLPGDVKKKLGDLGSTLKQAGRDLIQGMINGVKEKATDLANAAGDAVKGAVGKAKSLLGIKSPSRVFAGIGRDTVLGFIRGINQNTGAVGKSIERMMGAIDKAMKKDDITKKAASRMRAVVNAVAREAGKLRGLIASRASLASEVAGGLRGEFDLSEIAARDEFGFPGSGTRAVQVARSIANRMKAFGQRLAQLVRAGLPSPLVQEIAGMGSKDGLSVADTFASLSKAQMTQIRSAYTGFNRYASQVGSVVANQRYNGQINRQQDVLQSIEKGLERGLKGMRVQVDVGVDRGTSARIYRIGKRESERRD